MKRIVSVFLTLLLLSAPLSPAAHAAEPGVTATPTTAAVIVNGDFTEFDAYNIDGYNYFKLRDLAYALRGTDLGFEVIWDEDAGSIELIPETAYTPVGGEMEKSSLPTIEAQRSYHLVYYYGEALDLTAYNIGGNNYFKLREILAAFGIQVSWDGALGTIYIDSCSQKEVTVSTAAEFANAIASNTLIWVKPGVYDLTAFNDKSPQGFEISNINNLTIIGAGTDETEFINADRFAEILIFRNCRNISVSDVKAGHTPQTYECDAGVFNFDRCLDVTVNNCYLYGCGSIGISIRESESVVVSNTTITDCSLRAVSVRDSWNIVFDNCKITKNRSFAAIISVYSYYRPSEVTFNRCDISENGNFAWAFIHTEEIYETSKISLLFRECNLIGNTRAALGNPHLFEISENTVTFERCAIKNNKMTFEYYLYEPTYINCDISGNIFDAVD